jgi:hypothetical protein
MRSLPIADYQVANGLAGGRQSDHWQMLGQMVIQSINGWTAS